MRRKIKCSMSLTWAALFCIMGTVDKEHKLSDVAEGAFFWELLFRVFCCSQTGTRMAVMEPKECALDMVTG